MRLHGGSRCIGACWKRQQEGGALLPSCNLWLSLRALPPRALQVDVSDLSKPIDEEAIKVGGLVAGAAQCSRQPTPVCRPGAHMVAVFQHLMPSLPRQFVAFALLRRCRSQWPTSWRRWTR